MMTDGHAETKKSAPFHFLMGGHNSLKPKPQRKQETAAKPSMLLRVSKIATMEPTTKEQEQVAAAYWRTRCEVAERALHIAQTVKGNMLNSNDQFSCCMTELRLLRRVMDGDI